MWNDDRGAYSIVVPHYTKMKPTSLSFAKIQKKKTTPKKESAGTFKDDKEV